MTSKRISQKGFALVEAILFFVIVIMIAGTGYYVYNADKEASETLNATNKVSNAGAASAAVDTGKFLDIPEWGVRIPIPKAAPDLYAVKAGENRYVLSVHSLDGIDECAADKSGLGQLRRFISEEDLDSMPDVAGSPYSNKDVAASPKIGAYHYLITSGNGTCTDPNNKAWQTAHSAIITLKNSVTERPD